MDKNDATLTMIPTEEINAALAGKILNIHRMTANSPDLLSKSASLRNYLVKESQLTDRQREILILRTAHNLQSVYEWAHHVSRGRSAGLTDEEILRTTGSPGEFERWIEVEAGLLALVDEMVADQRLSERTTAIVIEGLGKAALVDAIFTVGFYITLGTILNTFDVPLDEHIEPVKMGSLDNN